MQKILLSVLGNTRYHQLVAQDTDRIVLTGVVGVPISLLLAIIKLVMSAIYLSTWLLGFGLYYLVMVLAKAWLAYRYTKIRLITDSTQQRTAAERQELGLGGLLFSLVGLIFSAFCYQMYHQGFNQHFSDNATYLIALIGFIKLISAVVGLVRTRRHKSTLISLLKAFGLADGCVALVLTQYAILTMQHSTSANSATGLFGLGIGLVILLVGLWFVFKSRHVSQH
jgi:hypothetical protein